jgi:hypothetical protein
VFAPISGQADTTIMGNIRGMVISPTGTLLVASATGNKVVEFAANGELLGNFIESGAGGLSGPWHMLFRESDLLVSASAGNIYQYDHDGTPLSVWENTINFPQQLHRQENGNVLAAAFSSPAGVWEFDQNGVEVGRYTGVASNRGVFPLENGNILTSNSGGVHEIDRGSALIETELSSSGVRMISEIERFRPCDEPGAVPWLSVSVTSGTTPAGGARTVTVLVDSTGLTPGAHEGHLCVNTNDPETPLIEVPVVVTVSDQTCDRTITGSHTGPLTVTSGLTCIAHGSVVTGPVSIGAGASIHVTGASIVGPVRADRAASVEVYGSKLVGPLTLRDGTKQVAVIGNRVTGPVSVDRNVTAPAPIVIAANTIVGPLRCAGNEPPPVNNGQPNSVTGPKSGQCRDL